MSHAIIPLNEDMCDLLNTGRYRAVIIDLEGAFDATWRKDLIYNLYHSGIKGGLLILFNIFLTDRMSRNNVNCYVSEWFPTTIGLPQGSRLSSILFLVYTGDLPADPKRCCPFYDHFFSLTMEKTNKNDLTPTTNWIQICWWLPMVNIKGNQRKYPLKLIKLLLLKYQRKG